MDQYVTENFDTDNPNGNLDDLATTDPHLWQLFSDFAAEVRNGCDFGGELSFEDYLVECLTAITPRLSKDHIMLQMVERVLWGVWLKREHDAAVLEGSDEEDDDSEEWKN